MGNRYHTIYIKRTYASNGWLLSTKDAHGYTTGFWYDGQGNPVLIHDPDGNPTEASYNNLGHRETLIDPNMGDWSYSYNGLGEVTGQTDANGVVFTFDYDDLGRLTNRTASCPAGSANSTMNDSWHYDAMPNTKGLLDRSVRSDCDLAQTTRSYAYDIYNRPTTMAQVISNNPNSTVSRMRVESRYDSYFARQASMTWYVDGTGSGFSDIPLVRQYNKYDINGYLVEQGDSRQYVGDTAANYNAASPAAWRHIDQMTPNGQIIEQQFGNDLVQTNQYFDATWQLHNSFIPDLQPDSPELMNYFYEYDLFGNITQQTSHSLVQAGGDTTMNHEQFSYDRLHRLVDSNRVHYIGGNMTGSSDISYEYDELGNIKDKTDFATNYQYFAQRCEGDIRPNAVNVVNRVEGGFAAYTYDCNGNMLTGPDKRIDYNAYNKPTRIANASNIATNEFWYDADEQRYLQRKGMTTTVYLDKMYERTGNIHKLYIDDFAVFTVDYQNSGEDTGITYLHTDRLGSVAVMSQANGDPVANASRGFDPFGKPREGDWMDDVDGDLNGYDETTRGFTGHEHMNESDLIHMNGRAYDYNLGRFLSVDPFIQMPANSQSLNPYSYIMNNPLAGTDPTGYMSESDQCYIDPRCGDGYERPGGAPDERDNRKGLKLDVTYSNGSTSSVTFAGNDQGGIDIYESTLNGVDNLGSPANIGLTGRIDPAYSLACDGLACRQSILSLRQIAARGAGLAVSDGPLPVGEILFALLIADQVIKHLQVHNAIQDIHNNDPGIIISPTGIPLGGFAESDSGLSDLRGPTLNKKSDDDSGNDSSDDKSETSKSESEVWKSLKPFRGGTRTNGQSGKRREYYEWDHTHNDIEVYDKNGRHKGSMHPDTGEIYKDPVPGRRIDI